MSADTQPLTGERALPRMREQTAPSGPVRSRKVPFACDIYENEDEYLVIADLPGVGTDALEATVHAERLSVHGTRITNDAEIVYERSFTLPQNAEVSAVAVTMKNGILRITIPKTHESKPRRIEVRAG